MRSGAVFSAGTAFSIPSITAGRVTFGAYRTGQLVRERRFRICEFIARSPRYKTEVTATIEKLDEDGFINNVSVCGLSLVRMEHDFHPTEDGTRFEHRLITPGNKRLWLLSQPVSAIMFTNTKGRAWLKHAIEEMGALENFLPQLYAREVGRESSPKQARNPATDRVRTR